MTMNNQFIFLSPPQELLQKVFSFEISRLDKAERFKVLVTG